MASTMAEIVYGTREEGHVMSDKVSQLASSVYSEFEKMIKKYDEDVVKELMPLVVGILESLDQAYSDKSEVDVEMELLREDNEQLLTQYEREKQLRKSADQKYLEMEDEREEYQKISEDKIESMESQIRMLELKNKNASDHLNRMENKEADLQKEYSKVHERYTELMRTHMDYMERAKMLMGSDRIAEMANSPRSRGGFQLPNLKSIGSVHLTGTPLGSTNSPPDASDFDMMSPRSGKDNNTSLKSELGELDTPDINSNTGRQVHVITETSDKEQNTDAVSVREFATATKPQEKTDVTSLPQVSTDNTDNKTDNKPSLTDDKNEKVADDKNEKLTDDTKVVSDVKDDSVNTQTVSDSVAIVTEELPQAETQTESKEVPNELESDNVNVEAKSVEPPAEVTKEIPEKSVISKDKVDGVSDKTVVESSTPAQSKQVQSKSKTKETARVKSDSDRKLSESDKNNSERPPSPLSPVFDSNDFSYEEDAMPGLDDTIAHIVATTPELDDMEESMESSGSMNNNRTNKRNNASIYDELTIQDADLIGDVDYGADITDSEDEKEERNSNVSDNFFGMSRELENLILENTELLATKNALNIVKDDLIAKVDELSSEQEILKEEIQSLKGVKDKLQGRIKDLEEEVKKTKEELEKKVQQAQEGENEDDVPMAQRKRFTRVEMARVLMERNQYKERLMELQEAVRWTEMIRASREHPEISQAKKKSSIWNFFSNLVAPDPPPAPTPKKKSPYETQIV